MKCIFLLVLLSISFSALARLDISSPLFKIENGKAIPYYGKSAVDSVHRQLGSIQINPSAAGITISKSGSYILADNINASAASGAIRIMADNVDFDLNGFFITNDSGVGIDVVGGAGIKNVAVRNGTVRTCSTGLQINGVTNLIVDSILATDNTSHGINVLSTKPSSNVLVTNCRAQSNVGDGFIFEDASVCELRQCQATDNASDGFAFTGTGYTFESCFSVGNTANGFYGTGTTVSEIVMRECQAKSNTGRGIFFDASITMTNLNIEECEVFNNTLSGIEALLSPTEVLVKNCTCNSNGGRGIRFGATGTLAERVTIEDCAISGNTLAGIEIEANNSIVNNNEVIRSSGGNGIYITGLSAHNVIKNNVSSTNSGNGIQIDVGAKGIFVEGNTVKNNSGIGINADPTATDANIFILRNVSQGNIGVGFVTATGSLTSLFIANVTDRGAATGASINGQAMFVTINVGAPAGNATPAWDSVGF